MDISSLDLRVVPVVSSNTHSLEFELNYPQHQLYFSKDYVPEDCFLMRTGNSFENVPKGTMLLINRHFTRPKGGKDELAVVEINGKLKCGILADNLSHDTSVMATHEVTIQHGHKVHFTAYFSTDFNKSKWKPVGNIIKVMKPVRKE